MVLRALLLWQSLQFCEEFNEKVCPNYGLYCIYMKRKKIINATMWEGRKEPNKQPKRKKEELRKERLKIKKEGQMITL